ncbi:MAG: hypothetical protein J7513_15740 [Solirubrobacteraceae bacterium]|nr:hypothetical protein [Solirubrobacteraceae bacterium]
MSSQSARILVVAHRTAATQALYNAVRDRAKHGPCEFTLLVPRAYWDGDTDEAAVTLELALPFLDRAARGHVEGIVGPIDPLDGIGELHRLEPFDEVILSTLPVHLSRWLRRDLPHRITRAFGLPVHVVTASNERHRDRERDAAHRREGHPDLESAVRGALPMNMHAHDDEPRRRLPMAAVRAARRARTRQ